MQMSERPPRSWLRALAGPVLLASLAFSPLSSAQSMAVTHAYSGEDCEIGSHNSSRDFIAVDGALTDKTTSSFFLTAFCPVIRTKPTYRRVDVLLYFADMDASGEENANATVSCHMDTADQNGASAPDFSNNVGLASKTMTGVFHQSPMSLSFTATATQSQPFWTDIISTNSLYRRTHITCDSLPHRIALRSYLVTEIP
jgi:hypothetical protein